MVPSRCHAADQRTDSLSHKRGGTKVVPLQKPPFYLRTAANTPVKRIVDVPVLNLKDAVPLIVFPEMTPAFEKSDVSKLKFTLLMDTLPPATTPFPTSNFPKAALKPGEQLEVRRATIPRPRFAPLV